MLYSNIAPKLDQIRKEIEDGHRPEVFWDLRNIESKKMSMAALTAFLALAHGLSKFYQKPIPTILRWDPDILRFLTDISFFRNSEELGILRWEKAMIGGLPTSRTRPTTRIMFKDEVPHYLNYADVREVESWKESKREELSDQFIIQFGDIFTDEHHIDEWSEHLKYSLSELVGELIVNGLLHGKSLTFLGVQRSGPGVSICVADHGIGFLGSMRKTNSWINELDINTNVEALFYASLMKEHDVGLRSVISDVIESSGWVIMSTDECEIRWAKKNWERSLSEFDVSNCRKTKQEITKALGAPAPRYLSKEDYKNGYYRNYSSVLKGTRITFEIPLFR